MELHGPNCLCSSCQNGLCQCSQRLVALFAHSYLAYAGSPARSPKQSMILLSKAYMWYAHIGTMFHMADTGTQHVLVLLQSKCILWNVGRHHIRVGWLNSCCLYFWVYHYAHGSSYGRYRHRTQHRADCWGETPSNVLLSLTVLRVYKMRR